MSSTPPVTAAAKPTATVAAKVDLKKSVPGYDARPGIFEVLTVPPLRYLALDGSGDPNSAPAYAEALAVLYPLAYALKFASKRAGRDYVVAPLEALWWSDDMSAFTTARDKARWNWTVLLLVPDWLGEPEVEAARALTHAKLAKDAARPPAAVLDRVRLETLDEGLCVQTLHVGPYDDEGPVLAELHDRVIPERGLRMTGRHHEVYLGDPRRVAPEKLRTILRQPVERV